MEPCRQGEIRTESSPESMIHRPPVTHGWEPLQGCELSEEASGCGLRTDARGKRGGVCTRWEGGGGSQHRKMVAQSQALMGVKNQQDLLTWGEEGSTGRGGAGVGDGSKVPGLGL